MAKYEVFPKDLDYAGIPWYTRAWIFLVGHPLIDDEGNIWGYSHKGSMYITADPVVSEDPQFPEATLSV
nr:hypothetical protein [Spirochaetales bacterium]